VGIQPGDRSVVPRGVRQRHKVLGKAVRQQATVSLAALRETKMTRTTTLKFLLAILLLSMVCHGQVPRRQTVASVPADPDGLVEAARNGNLRAIESILAAGVDVNAKSKNGETALAAVASAYKVISDTSYTTDTSGIDTVHRTFRKNANVGLAEVLLERGARLDDRSFGQTAIWVDIAFGWHQHPMPSYSFRCGNSIGPMSEQYSKADKLGTTALLAAAGAGNSAIVRLLVDRGADLHATTFEGVTALMLATIANDVESMKTLLANGADANAAANKGQTALMLASWSDGRNIGADRMEAVRLLVDSGANLNAQDDAGRSALMGAAEADNLEAARFLLSEGANVNARSKTGRTALMQAAHAGNVELLRVLLGSGADANAKDDDSRTALMEAAFLNRQPEAVTALLEGGASVQGGGNGAGSALLVAELAGRDDAIQVLKQAGASLSPNEELMLAADRGQTEKVRSLLAKGADPNARGTRGRPILIYAANVDNPDVARLLIETGADVNLRDNIGETPLMEASFNGATQVASLLVENGADVNSKSKTGMTPLINAAWRGRIEIVQLLIQRGADVNAQAESGSTALGMSQYGGRDSDEIARILKGAGAKQ